MKRRNGLVRTLRDRGFAERRGLGGDRHAGSSGRPSGEGHASGRTRALLVVPRRRRSRRAFLPQRSAAQRFSSIGAQSSLAKYLRIQRRSDRGRSRISGYPPEPATASIGSTSAAKTSATTIKAIGSTRRRPASNTSTSTGTRRRISTAPARRLSINGVGTTNLTLPPGFVRAATAAAIPGSINPFLHTFDLGIRRDTASGDVSLDSGRCLGRQGGLLPYASLRHAG